MLPLANGVSADKYELLQRALVVHLRQNGYQPDPVSERLSQPLYLPNVPPKGSMDHYTEFTVGSEGMDADIDIPAIALIREQDARERAEAEKAAAAAAVRRAERIATATANGSPASADVAGQWNAHCDFEDELTRAGFEQKNPGSPHWRSPNSESKSFAVRVYESGKAFSLHQSDKDAGLGIPVGEGVVFDAFDLYAHFEHNGDIKAAIRSAAKELGIEHKPQTPANVGVGSAALPDYEYATDTDSDHHGVDEESMTQKQLDIEAELDMAIEAAQIPEIDPAAFYGPLRQLVEACTENSEATKVGVALHFLACFNVMFGRPFFVELADEDAGLQMQLIQVGPSALGRKGTSAAPTDKRIMPALIGRAEALAAEINNAELMVNRVVTANNELNIQIADFVASKAELADVSAEGIAGMRAEIADAEAFIAVLKERRANMVDKVKTATSVSEKTIEGYRRGAENAYFEIVQNEQRIAHLQQRIATAERYLSNPDDVIREIDSAIEALQQQIQPTPTLADVPVWKRTLAAMGSKPITLRGLSSGEGLVHAIRDDRPYINDDGEEAILKGVDEKRMLINLSEFGGALAMMRRPGNSLSQVLRDSYDANPMEFSGKTSPESVAQHHIVLSASVTPAELAGLLFDGKDSAQQADNGLANRPVYCYVRRVKLVSRPVRSGGLESFAETVWANVLKVYEALCPREIHRSSEIRFTADGAAEWDAQYRHLDAMRGSTEKAAKLHGRVTTNGRKLAAILALANGEHEVSAECVKAAVAWMTYASATVDVVVSAVEDRIRQAKLTADAVKVHQSIIRLTEKAGGELPTRRDVARNTEMNAARLAAAINALQKAAPPLVVTQTERTPQGRNFIRIMAIGEVNP
jgi:hypothetical protein